VGPGHMAVAAVHRHRITRMTRNLPPTDSSDDGSAEPRLVAALESGDAGRIAAALVDSRLLVGVVALPGAEAASEGEMALALLESSSGARALPAFTSVANLARWRADARPVPRPASELAAAVRSEGLAALVLDVAGPVPWALRDGQVDALAQGYVPAGESLAARRADPVLHPPTWEPSSELLAACDGLEVYALDLEHPDLEHPDLEHPHLEHPHLEHPGPGPDRSPGRSPGRSPALGVVLPAGSAPAPVAERLLAASAEPVDLLVLDAVRRQVARRCGRLLGGSNSG
jgi:SseB protein N-terminal domain